MRRGRAHGRECWLGRSGVLECGANGVEHVRTGIAVGDRIHVQRVDLIGSALQTVGGGLEDAQ